MSEQAALAVWIGLAVYAGIGLFVALASVGFGLGRIDPAAANAPWRVRLLLLPGLTALWPLILMRLAGIRPREDRLRSVEPRGERRGNLP